VSESAWDRNEASLRHDLNALLAGMCFDREGKPVDDIVAWGLLRDDRAYAQLCDDDVNGVRVSTVWLGIDVGAKIDGRVPRIFETAIFDRAGHVTQTRSYCTEPEARKGHAEALDYVRTKEDDDP
jgi:hypothetical protein